MELLGSHPNILQVIGSSTYQGVPCLVLPWMYNGTIVEYILSKSNAPSAQTLCRKKLVRFFLLNIWFLVNNNDFIRRGTLRESNILVSENGDAVIADFGLSAFTECRSYWNFPIGYNTDDSGKSGAGTLRWMAPELFIPEDFDRSAALPTFESEVFAFGMTIYEIYSGRIPHYEDNICLVISNITKGNRPQRPAGLPDHIWRLIQKCWAHQPAVRLTIEAIHMRLRRE
ncbi:hypothetical protein HYPSUDRAFT_186740 [Hypholoma sublateritium FD-334 SS-4]|uniref:Protein kinase domain-containing protein n=1 Tax=Hypholoma sublateritium (strain FD-334 SS-4) TaxID=945553 RepID=A0A0D2NZY3_HYPSF|nr:hypothetical protein HYPSUDRAFT_186740 [Hypholoma sublateritium FD-334 SS-4]